MEYIIQKTIHEKWNYFLDKNHNWNGLEDNAFHFSQIVGETMFSAYQKKDRVNEIHSLIEINSLEAKPNSDVI